MSDASIAKPQNDNVKPPAAPPRGVITSERPDEHPEGGAFVIETSQVTAGIVVRQEDGYRFFSANDRFAPLEGSLFQTPKSAQQAAALLYRNGFGRNVRRFSHRARGGR